MIILVALMLIAVISWLFVVPWFVDEVLRLDDLSYFITSLTIMFLVPAVILQIIVWYQ